MVILPPELKAGLAALSSVDAADGLTNAQEDVLGTNPLTSDSDGDGISDFNETDGGNSTDTDNDGVIDALDSDSDNDTIPDSLESGDDNLATSPIDTDGDGIPDYADICMNTPEGVRVGQDGCPRKIKIADANPVKKERHQKIGRVDSQTGPARKFENILFDFDRFELKPQYYSVLNEIALMLSRNPETKVEIKGYTDNVGTAEYNQILSEKRAGRVKNYLVQKGVEKGRLFPVGFGFRINNSSNETEAGRALNRRVEISPISDQKMLAYKK